MKKSLEKTENKQLFTNDLHTHTHTHTHKHTHTGTDSVRQ